MYTKSLGVSSSCLVVFMALACANAGESDEVDFAQWELGESLVKLDKYLKSMYVRHDDRRIEEAKKLIMEESSANSGMKIAAQMVVDLNKLDRCTPKVLKYIQFLLDDYLERMDHEYIPFRLEKMLRAGVDRVKPICKSFMNTWNDQSERKIEPASKKKLYNFYTSELIAECDKPNRGFDLFDSTLLMKAVERDGDASKKLSTLKTEQQLTEFYQAYWEENVIKPCEKFMQAMDGVMKQGFQFKLGYGQVDLFDPLSQRYIESKFRYGRCRNPPKRAAAEMAAKKTLLDNRV